MATKKDLIINLRAKDLSGGPIGRLQNRLKAVSAAGRNVGSALQKSFAGLDRLAIAGVGATALIGKTVVGTAANFERLGTVLETLEGSSDKAKESLEWVKNFTAKTPFELDEVAESFVKLKAFGLDPMANGLMTTLGDTAAAMGKPVIQAVEAVADAMTGENERLKEFGIKASKVGDQIEYRFTQNGKTMVRAADANNSAMIQSTLQSIWNDKFSGAMDKQSRTWGGMWSNLMDQFTQFQLLISEQGIFDLLKTRLAELLLVIQRMQKDGSLQKLAKNISDKLVKAFKFLADDLPEIIRLFGGLENVLMALAAVKLTPVIASLIELGLALGLTIGPMIAIAGAIAYLVSRWENLTSAFSNRGFIGVMKVIFADMVEVFANIMEMVGKIPGFSNDFAVSQMRSRAEGLRVESGGFEAPIMDGARDKSEVTVKFDNLPNGARVDDTGTGNVNTELNYGFISAGAM